MGDVCRLCSSGTELINVCYRSSGDLRDMIKVASGVEILETDVISKKICILCCKIAGEVYKFRQRSSKNSQKLMEEYNERKQLELSKKTPSKKEINIDGINSKQLQSIDNKIKAPNEHPSIQQIKKQHPNLKFPLIPPNANFQPYITLLTNEVSDWYQQRNSTTDALFKVNEKRLKRPQSPKITPSSKNIQCSSSSEELDEICADGTEKQNKLEKAVTKNSSFRNIQDHEKNVHMETNQIDCQTNDKQDDSEQSQNKIDSISQPTEEENLEETRKRKSSKEKVQIDNEVNSEPTQNKIDSTTRKKRISEHTGEENLEEIPKRKSSKREVEYNNEVNSEQTQPKTDSTRRKRSIPQHTEEENLKEAPKRKSSKREVELDNEVLNKKQDTKFVEKAKNDRQVDNESQTEEKEADSFNNNKKESSSAKEISEIMETKKQKENKSSPKVKASNQEETQNKTSKLLQKNKEIEIKSTNLAKEKVVCNQTSDKEKPKNEVESRKASKDSKEPVIDFCALREILRTKLRRNSTHDETNNLESNVINTSTPPADTATSPTSNSLQKMSFIRSLDLIPSSERGEYEKDSNHEMLRIRCVKFVCLYCQTYYSTLRSLRAHEKKYHTSCTFCNLHLDSIEDRKKHMLFYCPNRTIKVPKVVLCKVDKQKEMVVKYAKAFQFLNFNASSNMEKLIAQQTGNPMDLETSESERNDGCADSVHNCQQYKLNWNVNYYNDVINTVNLGEPNLSVNIYNMIKDRTFYSLDTIVENTISHEYYLKNLSLELCFQKVKIVLICGKHMVYHYDKGKHLPAVTLKKDFWDNEAPIQPQVNRKNLRGEDCQRTVSQTHINLNHKTDKNNVNLQDSIKKITRYVNIQIPRETSTEAKGAQSVRNKTSLQNSNIKQNVVGHTNSVLSPQNANKVNIALPQRGTEIDMQGAIPRNVVSHDNETIQNRAARVELERLNMEKRREFQKANVKKHVTCSSDTAATIQVVNIENGDPSQIVTMKNMASTIADEKIHKKSGVVFESVNVENGTKHKMGTGETLGKIIMESRTVSQTMDTDNKMRRGTEASVLIKRPNVETGTIHERISVEKAAERNVVSKEAINEVDTVNKVTPKTANINTTPSVKTREAIQNPSIDKRVSPQVSTVQKNKGQNMQDIELIRLLEAEIEEIGRKDLPTQMPNIRREVAANTQVQEKALLQPTNLPGTSKQISGNRSQNLSSNYVILPSMSTANASQPATFNANVAPMPNIRGDVLANMHMFNKAPLQRSNLPVTSTQVSDNVSQRRLPTPLIYSVPSASSTNANQSSTLNLTGTVPNTGNSYILAGQNLIFISPQQRGTPVSQLQTSNNNRSLLRNRQTNVSLSSSSFQIPSSPIVSLQLQQSPASSSTNATNTFVSKIRVKDVKELS